ncbi:MAG: hypothetical protein D6706_17860 [Chloroflexi bacterium]|nr:MAG: hypothetical protein D6706_17860 [Chloroflexota bacterium]
MKYFAHTTIISPHTRIRRERLLPLRGDVITRVGQDVSPAQVVARTQLETDLFIVPASEQLGVPSDEVMAHLLVEIGSQVEQGTPVAEKKGRLGRKRQVLAPVDGVLYAVSNGRFVFQQFTYFIELRAMVSGRIINQIPNRGVIIETHGALIQGLWSAGEDTFGKLMVIARTTDSRFVAAHLRAETSGHILVAGRVDDPDVLFKAEENGVRGVITGSVTATVAEAAHKLIMPIVAIDGIGKMGMTEPAFQLLKEMDGEETSLFTGISTDRTNRPEIIIPAPMQPGVEAPKVRKGISVGQQVRILRAPYAGKVGVVTRLYKHVQQTGIHTVAYGADVKLDDEHEVFIPYSNMDVLVS